MLYNHGELVAAWLRSGLGNAMFYSEFVCSYIAF